MKNLYPAVLCAALGLASVTTARAATYNGDLLVGFTTQSGNDFIYDLGAANSLTDGQQWDLSSYLTSYNLSTVYWGIIGDKNVSGSRFAWTTTSGTTPNAIPGNTTWANLDTATASIYQNFAAAGTGQSLSIISSDQNSWNQQTIVGTLTTQYVNAYGNPNVQGITSDSYFQMAANNSAPTLAGNFNLANSGVLTFNVAPVPEPSSLSLLAGGGGLLLLAWRNKFGRKQI